MAVKHGAVAGELVVLVEHVQAEGTVAVPVVHRLECDQRELQVVGDVTEQRLGLQDDVALLDELLAGPEPRRPSP
jgi:hypothetical protein